MTPSRPLESAAATASVRVWDLPTRLFHWLLAAAVVGAVVTAKIGGNAMVWHFRCGLLILGLLAFRVLWGLVGGHWSRFFSFVPTPGGLWRYLRGTPRPGDHFEAGHSPLGALSVFGLLAVLVVQVATGLVADDEIANVGPLSRYVSTDTALAATGWHKHWGEYLVFALVGLHLLAILFYVFVKKRVLVRPMLAGDKLLPTGTPASADGGRQRLLALVLALVCAAGVVWVMRQSGQ